MAREILIFQDCAIIRMVSSEVGAKRFFYTQEMYGVARFVYTHRDNVRDFVQRLAVGGELHIQL